MPAERDPRTTPVKYSNVDPTAANARLLRLEVFNAKVSCWCTHEDGEVSGCDHAGLIGRIPDNPNDQSMICCICGQTDANHSCSCGCQVHNDCQAFRAANHTNDSEANIPDENPSGGTESN
jgi:hypothetical protein